MDRASRDPYRYIVTHLKKNVNDRSLTPRSVQPPAQHGPHTRRQFAAVARGILANLGDVMSSTHELVTVPDQPLLDPRGVGFHMKLQREYVVIDRKGLIRARGRRGEQFSVAREVKGVTVPVQYRRPRQLAQRPARPCRREIEWSIPDLDPTRRGVHPLAKCGGYELSAKADSQRPTVHLKARIDRRNLLAR